MAWGKETHNAFVRHYKAKVRLELAEARHAQGICPKCGVHPDNFNADLKDRVQKLQTEFEQFKASDYDSSE